MCHHACGKATRFYLEITNIDTGTRYTYHFYDNLKDHVLKEDNSVLFQIPYGQAFDSMEGFWENNELRGILSQGDGCYALYEEM